MYDEAEARRGAAGAASGGRGHLMRPPAAPLARAPVPWGGAPARARTLYRQYQDATAEDQSFKFKKQSQTPATNAARYCTGSASVWAARPALAESSL